MTMNTTEEWDRWTLAAMSRWGGSFVRSLRAAYGCADAENRRRLVLAWPEYGNQYKKMGEKLREEEGETQEIER